MIFESAQKGFRHFSWVVAVAVLTTTVLAERCVAEETIRVAAISYEPQKFDLENNADRLEQLFRNAHQGGAKIAVAPEGSLDGYVVIEANVGVTLIVDQNRITAIDRAREGITFAEITIPDSRPVNTILRDEEERQFLKWRTDEMQSRLVKRKESIKEQNTPPARK